MSLRKVAGLLAAFGLMVGLIGGGVGAVFSDQVTAQENVNVGTFACQITDATAGASIASDHKSVSYTAPTIMSSAAGSAPFSFTVQNSGSIPAVLTVTTSAVGAPFSIIGAPFAAVPVGPSATHVYDTGVQWGALDDTNLGQSGAVTWTVDCGEVAIPAFGAAYYAVNDGGTFGAPGTWCRSASPIASTPLVGGGTGTQSISGGSLAVSLNDVVDYADSGFYVPLGPLGSLTSYAIAAVGAPVTANIYLDTSGDGQFFAWTDECLSGLGGDAYGSGPSGTAFTIDDSSSFQMFTGGGTQTIAQLKAGGLPGVTASTQVAVWVGIAPTSGSVSTMITAAP